MCKGSYLVEYLEWSIQQEQFSWKFTKWITLHKIFVDLFIRLQFLTASFAGISHYIHLQCQRRKKQIHQLLHSRETHSDIAFVDSVQYHLKQQQFR